MKIAIRRGVFETNSSSTHSISICSKEEYDKWKAGELLYDDNYRAEKQFITREEAIKKLKESKYYKDLDYSNKDDLDEALEEKEFKTLEKYFDNNLESFEKTFTTKSGEVIIAFGLYGYDG